MRNRRSRMFRRRSNGRNFRRQNSGDNLRLIPNAFSNDRIKSNFKQHQSAEKLLEKYKILAKEALSSGDKILSENYLQHADHFERIVRDKISSQNQNGTQIAEPVKKQNDSLPVNEITNQNQETEKKE